MKANSKESNVFNMGKGIKTSSQIVKSGEPQDSVLCPVLILLFVNDIHLFIGEIDVDKFAGDIRQRE